VLSVKFPKLKSPSYCKKPDTWHTRRAGTGGYQSSC
jgi:hypothetical protein